MFKQATDFLETNSVELEIYELCLARQYQRIWDVATHKDFDRNIYLFAKWSSRYYNQVHALLTALSGNSQGILRSIDSEAARFFRPTEDLDLAIRQLRELRILSEKARSIEQSHLVKAMKDYLMRQLRQVIRTDEVWSGDLWPYDVWPYEPLHKTLRLHVSRTVQSAWQRVEQVFVPAWTVLTYVESGPFEGMVLEAASQ